MNLFAGQQWRRRQNRTDLWTQRGKERVGRTEGEGRTDGKRSMET